MTTIDELSPVSGRESVFFTFLVAATVTAVATVVVVVAAGGATVVVGAAMVVVIAAGAGATGIPVTALEAAESPISFTALMLTEYVVPLVRPLMVNGLVVVAGFSTT